MQVDDGSYPGGRRETYIPLGFELLQPHEGLHDGLIGENGIVLLQRPLADLGVIRLGYGILEESLLQLVEGDDDAEDFGEGVMQVPLRAVVCEFYLLGDIQSVSQSVYQSVDDQPREGEEGLTRKRVNITSSRLMVAESAVFGT